MNLETSHIRHFVGSKDFQQSRDFYVALGWTLEFETEGVAELRIGESSFYLQDYYAKEWCENSMLHITVEDATAWFAHLTAVIGSGEFGDARVSEPAEQEYGAYVTFAWDPSGVLLHFAEPLPYKV